MPHALVLGSFDLAAVARRWRAIEGRLPGGLFRTGEIYVSAGGRRMLVEATAVQDGLAQKYLIRVSARPDGAMVRLDPMTDPPLKTPAVRGSLAALARWLRDDCGGTGIGATNLRADLDQR